MGPGDGVDEEVLRVVMEKKRKLTFSPAVRKKRGCHIDKFGLFCVTLLLGGTAILVTTGIMLGTIPVAIETPPPPKTEPAPAPPPDTPLRDVLLWLETVAKDMKDEEARALRERFKQCFPEVARFAAERESGETK